VCREKSVVAVGQVIRMKVKEGVHLSHKVVAALLRLS